LRLRLQNVRVEAVQNPLESPLDGDELMTLFGRPAGPWLKPLKLLLHDYVVAGVLQSGNKDGAFRAAQAYMEDEERVHSEMQRMANEHMDQYIKEQESKE
jgi:hypothetical protein